FTVNGREIEVEQGLTVLQACEQAGVEIPRFCYHERLSIAGNCRMCLVAMERSPKPIASCAMPAADGMVIHTDTPEVQKARKGVMEFLLINHPLDCPICDQGGECDLQDQAMGYGPDHSRFHENKRAVPEKYMGPLIKTFMTRCIHCTRCIRFATEVAGVPELGATGRGEHVEVGTYVGKALSSELSGNLIDLCPVGALTSAPYAFHARSWELRKTESVDVMDAVGSNIRVDARGLEVLRVLPRTNDEVNEEWISDKTRFACDGLRRQRLDRPYVRCDGKLHPATWSEAFAAIADRLRGVDGVRVAALAGDSADAESMFALKGLMASLGSPNRDCRQDGAKLEAGVRASYLFNTTIAGIERADACLLIGTNPRREATVLNARLRKRHLAGGFPIGLIGEAADLTYAYQHLGAGPETLAELVAGRHPFADTLDKAETPMLILGMGALARADGAAVLFAARRLAEQCGLVDPDHAWNGFNVLQMAAARVGGLDLGFVPADGGRDTEAILDGAGKGEIEVVYLLGADEIDTGRLGEAFVIYQGHHGDAGAMRADVVLPGGAYTEKHGTYVNTEGRPQIGRPAVSPPGDAREDWTIIRALSAALGCALPFDELASLRAAIEEAHPVFARIDEATPANWAAFGRDAETGVDPFASPVANYYMTDPISRASATMAQCTATFVSGADTKTGTHG
ncbi:MAG TPA: NADH-quinone oxidoreductase subunit NuoG, partial [Rhodospirillales bacterium]|nr:NADH-quinone oxidoreductase subunit NuoG [Rhodospirillales bacterium]